jgi:hypothetical protein
MRLTRVAEARAGLWACGALALAGAACRPRALALIPVDDAATSPAPPSPPAEEPNEVHYTFTGPGRVTFDWLGNGRTVRVWSKGTPPRTVSAHAPDTQPFSLPGPWQEADVDGLAPGVEYAYEIGNPTRPQEVTFRAPPAPGATGFTFAAMGDVGASTETPEVRALHRLVSLAEPAFVLMLGDLTYADTHTQASVDRHFEDVMAWSRRAAYMPVWGNHEWETPAKDDLRNYKGRFALPHAQASKGAPATGCCGEDWYWFDYGAVRFVTYPEPYAADTLDEWAARAEPLLAEAEKDPKLRFVITYGHRPAYSSGHHGGDPQLRRILDRFGRRFPKYVLNLSGHSHVYERTRPQAHVVHVTVGTGGGELEHAATPCLWNDCKMPAIDAFRAIHHGFLKLAVEPNGIHIEAVCGPAVQGYDDRRCAEGEIMDTAVIR